MRIHYIDRGDYRAKNDPRIISKLQADFGPFLLLPEGGTNRLAVKGCKEILADVDLGFDTVCCPVGTGGTLAGIINHLKEEQNAIGFAALKGADFLVGDIQQLLSADVSGNQWSVCLDYHFGGYAKGSRELFNFIDHFELDHGLRLDPVYNGKMMFGLMDLIRGDHFAPCTRIIAVHTGGFSDVKT